jgi:hypothetical protein
VTILGLIANIALALTANGEAAVAPPSAVPQPSAPKASIVGVWRGTSKCVKVAEAEFCKDETVVYNVFEIPDKPGTVGLRAARVVDDDILPMYELVFNYQADTGAWTSEFERPNFRGVWSYVVQGDEMTGTATILPSLKVVRNVSVKRVAKDQAIPH